MLNIETDCTMMYYGGYDEILDFIITVSIIIYSMRFIPSSRDVVAPYSIQYFSCKVSVSFSKLDLSVVVVAQRQQGANYYSTLK